MLSVSRKTNPQSKVLTSSGVGSTSGRSHWISTKTLAIAAVILTIISLLIQLPGSFGIVFLGGLTAIAWPQFRRLKLRAKYRWAIPFFLVGLVTFLSALWLNVSIDAAHAQFFFAAEEFFKDTLQTPDTATNIVFGALRALYILYVAVAFIGVINAVRQDEDWQTVARTPVLVIVVITLADIMTNLIVGDGDAPAASLLIQFLG